MNNLIIGIAGGSGSGKTTLAYRLKERFGEDEVRLISHDSYYKRNADIIIPNGGENGPAIEMLAHHIRSLIQKANLR